ncbi:MAG TPA: TSUP family transporter [Flavobacteriales bacterium]|nr:TSUP family transporter [Flavobacteriales bacterium]
MEATLKPVTPLPKVRHAQAGNKLFPVFLKFDKINLLIAGGGKIGFEKLNAILENDPDAKISLVAPEISPEIEKLAAFHDVRLLRRKFRPSDLDDKNLVIVAVDNKNVSTFIQEEANTRKILVNVADKPNQCDFYLSSIVKKDDLKIAISTNGKSPTMAKRLKEVFDREIPNEIGTSIDNLNRLRTFLKGDFKSKVEQLNKHTAILVKEKSKSAWDKIKTWIVYALFAVSLMFVGHLILESIGIKTFYNGVGSFVSSLDSLFLWFVLAGGIAALVDGVLGMAYGVSATTALLSLGITPAAASMSVHASEIFTSGVSGLMHLKFGNVNIRLFKAIVLPGVAGAIIGAFALSYFENYSHYIKPVVGLYTLLLGIIILSKAFGKLHRKKKNRKLGPLALTGGFLDSIGGGGWGPIVSSTLIADGRNPRYTIGTVNLTEFFVALSSSVAFFTVIGGGYWQIILGLVIGGCITAPIAARFAGKISTKSLMILVGTLVIFISLRIILLALF